MNIFQRIGVFLMRIVALIFIFFGVGGLLLFVFSSLLDLSASGVTNDYALFSTAFYLVSGIGLMLFANVFGKLLGWGLSDSNDRDD